MYNSDGSLRVKTGATKGVKGSIDLSWKEEGAKENNGLVPSQSPKASPKAAGKKTRVTHIDGSDSHLKPKQRPGSEARARDNLSSLSQEDPQQPSRISDAKKKALHNSHVFNTGSGTPEAPTAELSKLKMREVTGHDIFNLSDAPQEQVRNILGGVRKEPGGGSSLRMDNLHPGTPTAVANGDRITKQQHLVLDEPRHPAIW